MPIKTEKFVTCICKYLKIVLLRQQKISLTTSNKITPEETQVSWSHFSGSVLSNYKTNYDNNPVSFLKETTKALLRNKKDTLSRKKDVLIKFAAGIIKSVSKGGRGCEYPAIVSMVRFQWERVIFHSVGGDKSVRTRPPYFIAGQFSSDPINCGGWCGRRDCCLNLSRHGHRATRHGHPATSHRATLRPAPPVARSRDIPFS